MPDLSIGEIKYTITLHKKKYLTIFLRNFGLGLRPNFGPKSGPKNHWYD